MVIRMSRLLRVGFIGVGGISQGAHAPAVKNVEILRLSSCADIDEKRLKAFQERFGCERGYTDYREMLEKEKPDIVLVATPHSAHARVAIDALESGSHVYLEKPMAVSLEEALRIADAARRRDRILVVGHVYRFSPARMTARKVIQGGRLGRIYHSRSLLLRRKGIPNSPTFLKKDLAGGGVVLDIGSHAVDSLLFIRGFELPKHVSGITYRAFSKRFDVLMGYPLPVPPKPEELGEIEVEDFGSGFIRFSDSSTAYIEVSWASYLRDEVDEVMILGDRGGVTVDGRANRLYYVMSIDDEYMISEALLTQPRENAFTRAWRLLGEAVASGRDRAPYPLCTAEQGVLNIAILDAIYRSASLGREVDVNIPKWVAENLGW